MKVEELITRVKRQFGDEAGVQIREEDIVRWINEAQNDIAQAQKIMESKASTTLIAGTSEYTLPPRLVELKHVFWKNVKLKPLSINEFYEYPDSYWDNNGPFSQPGNPVCYISWGNDGVDYIEIKPAPNDEAAKEPLVIYYSAFPAPVTSQIGDLHIPERYHNRVLEYCIQQAYELDENFEAAAYKGTQFSTSMIQMAGDEQWDGKETYPTITVLWEDW